jgi:hypothetical protein
MRASVHVLAKPDARIQEPAAEFDRRGPEEIPF